MQSLRELYKIGRGPSSSHTMGPERAVKIMLARYPEADAFRVTLYGSLASTGEGHGTDRVIREVLTPLPTEIEFGGHAPEGFHPNTLDLYAYKAGEQIGYLVADTAMLYRTNAEDITMEPFTMDLPAEDGDDLQISGSIEAKNTLIGAVEIAVTDQQGQVVSQSRRITDSFMVDLRTLNDDLDLSELEDGAYTVTVRAETAAAYISMGQLHYSNKTILLGQQSMLIGNAEAPARARTAPLKEEKDGWYWENGTWYLYKNNAPQTGWLRDGGVRYYLQADGSVTPGTAKIDGKEYCSSSTGALCTGWITSGFNTGYVLPDGTTAYGWQIINGSRYFFDVQGNMVKRGTLMDGGVKYQFQSDGKATPVMDK